MIKLKIFPKICFFLGNSALQMSTILILHNFKLKSLGEISNEWTRHTSPYAEIRQHQHCSPKIVGSLKYSHRPDKYLYIFSWIVHWTERIIFNTMRMTLLSRNLERNVCINQERHLLIFFKWTILELTCYYNGQISTTIFILWNNVILKISQEFLKKTQEPKWKFSLVVKYFRNFLV